MPRSGGGGHSEVPIEEADEPLQRVRRGLARIVPGGVIPEPGAESAVRHPVSCGRRPIRRRRLRVRGENKNGYMRRHDQSGERRSEQGKGDRPLGGSRSVAVMSRPARRTSAWSVRAVDRHPRLRMSWVNDVSRGGPWMMPWSALTKVPLP